MDRTSLGSQIAARLVRDQETFRAQFLDPREHGGGRSHLFVVDDVLDTSDGDAIHEAFPETGTMMLRRSLREHKYVAAQMDRYDPLLEEAIYAFQEPAVVEALSAITGLPGLEPDEHLYAGGVSVMKQGQFLNPHIDNSHDKDRRVYRVLNLLYYVTPQWRPEFGGSLQLWEDGERRAPHRTIPSLFNRMVVMGTTRRSWHSVSPIVHDGDRCCVSNYYFASVPLLDDGDEDREHFHPTSFRGFPGEPVKNLVLRGDAMARSGIRRIRRGGLRAPSHLYRRS